MEPAAPADDAVVPVAAALLDAPRAIAAAVSAARSAGLDADDGAVLHASNTLIIRVLPADVVARVGTGAREDAQREVDIAHGLLRLGTPVVPVLPADDPRVLVADGLVMTLWAHRPPIPGPIPVAEQAAALHRVHAGMRALDIPVPEASDRVDAALALLADPRRTPDLASDDRALLTSTLRALRPDVAGSPTAQILHGEPHPGNLIATAHGPELLDFETCCRGPVEFDLAHAPADVAASYPGADAALVARCRRLVLAMVTTWRFDREDRFPDGAALGRAWLADLREGRDPFAAV